MKKLKFIIALTIIFSTMAVQAQNPKGQPQKKTTNQSSQKQTTKPAVNKPTKPTISKDECADRIADTLMANKTFLECFKSAKSKKGQISCLERYYASLKNLSSLLVTYQQFPAGDTKTTKLGNNSTMSESTIGSLADTFSPDEAVTFKKKVDELVTVTKNEIDLLTKEATNFQDFQNDLNDAFDYFSNFGMK